MERKKHQAKILTNHLLTRRSFIQMKTLKTMTQAIILKKENLLLTITILIRLRSTLKTISCLTTSSHMTGQVSLYLIRTSTGTLVKLTKRWVALSIQLMKLTLKILSTKDTSLCKRSLSLHTSMQMAKLPSTTANNNTVTQSTLKKIRLMIESLMITCLNKQISSILHH